MVSFSFLKKIDLIQEDLSKELYLGDQGKKQSKQDKDISLSLPVKIFLFYLPHFSKKELHDYVFYFAEQNTIKGITFYAYKKYKDGYMVEIQEGGSAKGVLNSVIELLETNDSITIQTSSRYVKFVRAPHGIGFSSYFLSEQAKKEALTQTEGVVFDTPLLPVEKKYLWLKTLAKSFFLVASLAFISSLYFKYYLFVQSEPEIINIAYDDLPLYQAETIKNLSIHDGEYLSAIKYSAKNKWSFDIKKDKKYLAEKVKQKTALKEKIEKIINKTEGIRNE